MPTSIASVVVLVPAWRVDRTFDYRLPESLAQDVRIGSLVRVPFGARKVRAVVVGLDAYSGRDRLEQVEALVTAEPVAPGEGPALLSWLARRYVVPLGRAFERAVPPRVRVKARRPSPLGPYGEAQLLPGYEGGRELLAALGSAEGPQTWCIRALPGHDRAVLIGEAIAAVGARPGAALVAVPEVRFGSKVLDDLGARFGDMARVDSAQSEGDRSRAWLGLSAGTGLGGGGRAVVLAPAEHIALIVIDDEHHIAYKEDRAPRYDARRAALERARLQEAACVLVSATPTLESAQAVRAGDMGLAAPDRGAQRAARPVIEVVDPPEDRIVSHVLHERATKALRARKRVALLAPARGYARALWCAACYSSLRCPRCESGLFFDRAAARVRCARCNLIGPAPEACPTCGASDFRHIGAGSERLAEQVAKVFPRARVRRVDPDVIDETFEGEAADVYVTTWIGTKPAIRPDVALVGVLNADALIRRPDWRAAESAYQAFAALAEWAGPAAAGGRMVLQCAEPAHHSVQAVMRADYAYFAERELAHRAELGYPPFSELIRAVSFGSRRSGLIERVAGVARRAGARVLGPLEIAQEMAEGAYEDGLEVLIKCERAEAVCEELRGILASVPRGSMLRVDVDPR